MHPCPGCSEWNPMTLRVIASLSNFVRCICSQARHELRSVQLRVEALFSPGRVWQRGGGCCSGMGCDSAYGDACMGRPRKGAAGGVRRPGVPVVHQHNDTTQASSVALARSCDLLRFGVVPAPLPRPSAPPRRCPPSPLASGLAGLVVGRPRAPASSLISALSYRKAQFVDWSPARTRWAWRRSPLVGGVLLRGRAPNRALVSRVRRLDLCAPPQSAFAFVASVVGIAHVSSSCAPPRAIRWRACPRMLVARAPSFV